MRLAFAQPLVGFLTLMAHADPASAINPVAPDPSASTSPEAAIPGSIPPSEAAGHGARRVIDSKAAPSTPPPIKRVTRIVYSLGELATPLPSLAALQIGAYQNEGNALAASRAFEFHYGNLGGLTTTSIRKVDLGANGIWYRLRVGPFADRTVAMVACAKLKTQGADCILVAMR